MCDVNFDGCFEQKRFFFRQSFEFPIFFFFFLSAKLCVPELERMSSLLDMSDREKWKGMFGKLKNCRSQRKGWEAHSVIFYVSYLYIFDVRTTYKYIYDVRTTLMHIRYIFITMFIIFYIFVLFWSVLAILVQIKASFVLCQCLLVS